MRPSVARGGTGAKLIAVLAAITMVLPLMVVVAAPAGATDTNQTSHWKAFLEGEGYTNVSCDKIEGESQTNFVADADYTLVIVKKGSGANENALYWEVGDGDVLAPNQGGKPVNASEWVGYSHVITCVGDLPQTDPDPDEAKASVVGECVAGTFVVKVDTVNSTVWVDLNGNGSVDGGESELITGDHPVSAAPGLSIGYEATAEDGAAFIGQAPTGSMTVLDCARETPPEDADVTHELRCEVLWNGQAFELYGVVGFDVTAGSVDKIDVIRMGGGLVASWEPGDQPIWLAPWSYEYEVTYEEGFEGSEGDDFEMDRAWFDTCSCPSGTVDLTNTGVLRQPNGTSRAGEPASPVDVAAGKYHIYLASFDDHSTKASQDQNQEMWALADASLSGPPTWISPKTGDLPESVNFMSYHVTGGGPVSVPAFNDQTLWTVHQGSAASVNSVEPVCAKLLKVSSEPAPRGEIEVTKTPSSSVVESGQAVTFTVLVENVANVDVSIELIEDDVFGEIAPSKSASVLSTNCTVPQPLAAAGEAGDSYSCTFTATVVGAAGSDHTNTVTVSGEDMHDNEISDSDSATVSIVAPLEVGSIEVTKSADAESVTAPAEVTYTIEVENSSGVSVTIQRIEDDIYGEIAPTKSSAVVSTNCSVPRTLAADDGTGGSGDDFYSCQFVGVVDGEADAVHTNVVEVSGIDANSNIVSDSDSATVIIDEVKGIIIPETPATPVDIPDIVSDNEVEVDELPFTGVDSDRLLGLAIMLLGGGVLLLRWAPGKEDG